MIPKEISNFLTRPSERVRIPPECVLAQAMFDWFVDNVIKIQNYG